MHNTQKRSGLGEGNTSGRHVLAPSTTRRHLPPPWNNPHPARPRREMASPSHTSGRSPPKESGPAHPQFANCPACAAKWTRPPGAGWAPGASRGRSSGLDSVLAVKKTSTLNGRFLLPRPISQRDDETGSEDSGTSAFGEWYHQNPPESRARASPPSGSETTGPAGSGPRTVATASAFLSHARSRPRLATQRRGFAHRTVSSRGPTSLTY